MTIEPTHDLAQYDDGTLEAVDAAEDCLATINTTLQQFRSNMLEDGAVLKYLRLRAHALKNIGASYAIPALKSLPHRLEDYLQDVDRITDKVLADTQRFVDCISKVVEEKLDATPEELAELMRRLPARGGFDASDIQILNVEVMLVMTPGAGTRYVLRELQECGYRMVHVGSTAEALQLIPSMRPDLVIASNIMRELTGVDLACAIKAMPATRDIPIAVITSEARDHDSLRDLPASVPTLGKGDRFSDDVAEAFTELGML